MESKENEYSEQEEIIGEGEDIEDLEAEGEDEEEGQNQASLEIAQLEQTLKDLTSTSTSLDITKNLNKEELIAEAKSYKAAQQKKGIIYLPKIPPFMNPSTIKRLFKKFNCERMYLSPESEGARKARRKNGGNYKLKFKEGWIEFADKKVAKEVARCLNGQLVGGKKRHNLNRDDTWLMRYLPKFKWENLKEKFEYDKKVREERLKMSLSQAKREQNFYLEKAEISKKVKYATERQKKRKSKGDDKEKEQLMDRFEKKRRKNIEKTIKYQQKHQRTYKQKEPKIKEL
ncbi:unnamed protein product [Moneuplotes crassus]|uniref:18S rRNA factor 2 n=1 Tax=Euplotes crassus TaxID=5936 RepID=A0AAD1XPY9_EUPCR|nr:unnamed protein product [Moneuplotes crassus]